MHSQAPAVPPTRPSLHATPGSAGARLPGGLPFPGPSPRPCLVCTPHPMAGTCPLITAEPLMRKRLLREEMSPERAGGGGGAAARGLSTCPAAGPGDPNSGTSRSSARPLPSSSCSHTTRHIRNHHRSMNCRVPQQMRRCQQRVSRNPKKQGDSNGGKTRHLRPRPLSLSRVWGCGPWASGKTGALGHSHQDTAVALSLCHLRPTEGPVCRSEQTTCYLRKFNRLLGPH